MQTIGIILTFIVGIEHIGICFLEIFGKPATQAKAFDMDINFVKQRAAKISMANQGIYNGMLGLLLILVYFVFKAPVVFTAIFGGFTATKKIFVVQMLPALLALIFLLS